MKPEFSSHDKKFTFQEFHDRYIQKFLTQYYIFNPELGYIVWRFSTGENVELLHIRAFKSGEGIGQRLIKAMINELQKNPPYHSVFGFTLADNTRAHKMYKSAGFDLSECPFPYKGGKSMIFCQTYDVLVKKYLADKTTDEELLKNSLKNT